MTELFRFIRRALAASILASLLSTTGCSLLPGIEKLEDAKLADYGQHLISLNEDPFGTLTRSSGEVLQLRLSTLFPQGSASTRIEDFLPATATGLNRALAQAERPTSSLAQIALRTKTLALCRGDLTLLDSGAIFSETGIYLRGESAPSATAEKLALAAARNAWLYPYRAGSPEVIELANLYVTLQATGGDAEARRGLCIAVVSAPQFSIGNPKRGDAVRRAYLEIGRRLPNLQDIDDFETGKTTLGAIVAKIQTDASLKDGYLESVRSWHREWLGLRPFLEGGETYEPRRYNGAASGTYGLVLGADIVNVADLGGKKVVGVSNDGGFQIQNCSLMNGAQPNVQPFDPRTTMIVWEFRNPVANRWEVFGGYVHPDRVADYVALISAYAGATVAAQARAGCESMDTIDPAHAVAGAPGYLRCPGRIGGAGGGFVATALSDLGADKLTGAVTGGGALTFIDARLREQSVLSAFVPSTRFEKKDMRVRRFAPSGEQNGVSAVRLWYTGETVYMCNGLERYFATCDYRPPRYVEGPTGWAWIADYGWNAANSWMKYGTYLRSDSIANPRILNQMRCGVPNGTELASTTTAPAEATAYPLGYDGSAAGYLAATPPAESALNAVATNVNNRGAGVLEADAIRRLRESLNEEPYRLVNYILENNLPYSDLVTAKYTVGSPELELYYRALGQHLPVYPAGAGPSTATDVRVIRLDQIPAISSNLIAPPRAANDASKPVALRAKPAAGILTMPAFLTPVGTHLRTIASRYFTRLLCGEANVFHPNAAQAAIHEQYMADSANQVASASVKAHLDHRQVCYGCHVNLDPLGQALGPKYLRYVQENERAAMTGEMEFTETSNQPRNMLGGTWGTSVGKGAFLGQEVSGVESVGAVVAKSDLFARCIVRRTFENVVGRPLANTDEAEFARWVSEFRRTGMNYNRLIRTIVDSPIYSGGN